MFISGILIFRYQKQKLLEEKKIAMKTTAEEYSKFIQEQINTLKVLVVNTANLISDEPISNLPNSKDKLSKIFSYTNKSLPIISSIYFVDNKDGISYSHTGLHNKIKESGVDLRQRDWYKSSINSDQVLVSSVYYDINYHKPVITLSYGVKSNNKVLGILAADIFLDDFNKEFYLFTKSHSLNNYILDSNGVIIAHEKKDLIGHNMKHVKINNTLLTNYINLWNEQFSNKKSGMVQYADFTGDKIYAYFQKIDNLNWTLVCKIHENMLLDDAWKYSSKILLLIVVLYAIIIFFGYYIFKKAYYIDKLTGVFNKKYFKSIIKERKKVFKEQNALIININNFSVINSKYGSDIGDLILNKFAELTNHYVGSECDIFRLGADNFLCLFKKNIWEKSVQSAKLLHLKLKQLNIDIQDISININAFIGLINIDMRRIEDAGTAIHIFENIIKDLKHKSTSELIICPNIEEMVKKIRENDEKLNFLVDVINENKLVPFFQPIIDLDTMQINKYETLMRIDNKGKYLSPYPYILLAEYHNMISNIDIIVAEKALKYKSLVDRDDKLELSINLSGKELENKQHIINIIEIVDKYHILHKNIIFEITETQNIQNLNEVSQLVKEIKNLGFKFSIDDFGTGFSSMQYLKLLPVEYIKIDGSFIKDILDKEENEHLVKAMVNMARAYKIKVVAEFVENEAIMNKIKELGIEYGQGYFIGMPDKNFVT
ncbi:GGDEF domain-containing protein [Clostridium sp. ZS2-4]|nr:GGDEF domain-containing protein [Clostridium sp. ZS2-4]